MPPGPASFLFFNDVFDVLYFLNVFDLVAVTVPCNLLVFLPPQELGTVHLELLLLAYLHFFLLSHYLYQFLLALDFLPLRLHHPSYDSLILPPRYLLDPELLFVTLDLQVVVFLRVESIAGPEMCVLY